MMNWDELRAILDPIEVESLDIDYKRISSHKAKRLLEWIPEAHNGYLCPVCWEDGETTYAPDEAVWYSPHRYSFHPDCWQYFEWDEIHQCPECNSYFVVLDNANC